MNEKTKGSGSTRERDGGAATGGGILPSAPQSDSKVPRKNRVFGRSAPAIRWEAFSGAVKALSKGQREFLFWAVLSLSGAGVLFFSTGKPEVAQEPQNTPLSLRVPKGKRAYPLEIEHSIALSPGDRFDLFGKKDALGPFHSLIENILVLEVYSPRQVVAALTPDEIGWVEVAMQAGKLKVAVRGPNEAGTGKRTTPYRRRTGKARRSQISIWED